MRLLLLLLVTLLPPSLVAQPHPESSLDEQRARFIEAERALQAGQRQRYAELLPHLADYPLLPYLVAEDISSRIASARAEELHAFLERWGDSLPGATVRSRWLARLAGQGDWRGYMAAYVEDGNTTRACHYHRALLETGRRDEALRSGEALWLVGRSQPSACDPLFAALRASGRLTPEHVWQRIELSMAAGQPGLANYLKRYLPAAEQTWVDRWLLLHREPARLATIDWNGNAHPRAAQIIRHGFIRYGRSNLARAIEVWDRRADEFALPPDQAGQVDRALALRLAQRRSEGALERLNGLSEAAFDANLRGWHVRAALAEQDWATVVAVIRRMPPDEHEESDWRYWLARALEQLGDYAEAERLYTELAGERNFYGFLAADRMGKPYRIGHAALQPTAEQLQAALADPGVQRAGELFRLGRIPEARREWQHTIARLEPEQLLAAAYVADQWGWRDRAIFTSARARFFDDIDLRFPVDHLDLISVEAQRRELNPAWPIAVLRQESAFMADARSPAGALGLMQVMPATGRAMARHAGVQLRNDRQLLDPATSVRIGTYYLRRNLDLFEGHTLLATAAYNAGNARVRSWLPEQGSIDADIWAELIPFNETRGYVRRVLAYKVFYEVRMGREPTPISRYMTPVAPQGQIAQVAGDRPLRLATFCDAPGYTERTCQ